MCTVDFQKVQLIFDGVENGDRLGRRPMERTGIDDPRPAFSAIGLAMGVAVENVIILLRLAHLTKDTFVAVANSNGFAVRFDHYGDSFGPLSADSLNHRSPSRLWGVHVAPHKPAGSSSEQFQRFQAAQIAAMDDGLDSPVIEHLQSLTDRPKSAMIV